MKTMFIIVAFLVVLAGLVLFAFPSILPFDTQYAPGYSERAFRSIRIGDTAERAITLLGAPLSTNTCEPYVAWIYSDDRQPNFPKNGTGSGTYTMFTFQQGAVKGVFGQRQSSPNTFTFGGGAGFLTLTDGDLEQLKGCPPEAIKKRFGAPRAVYEHKAIKQLRYSRSPSSSNYHLRMLGLDIEGKVVSIERSIYWD